MSEGSANTTIPTVVSRIHDSINLEVNPSSVANAMESLRCGLLSIPSNCKDDAARPETFVYRKLREVNTVDNYFTIKKQRFPVTVLVKIPQVDIVNYPACKIVTIRAGEKLIDRFPNAQYVSASNDKGIIIFECPAMDITVEQAMRPDTKLPTTGIVALGTFSKIDEAEFPIVNGKRVASLIEGYSTWSFGFRKLFIHVIDDPDTAWKILKKRHDILTGKKKEKVTRCQPYGKVTIADLVYLSNFVLDQLRDNPKLQTINRLYANAYLSFRRQTPRRFIDAMHLAYYAVCTVHRLNIKIGDTVRHLFEKKLSDIEAKVASTIEKDINCEERVLFTVIYSYLKDGRKK